MTKSGDDAFFEYVDWIISDSKAYIDTGLKGNQDTISKIKIKKTSDDVATERIFGALPSDRRYHVFSYNNVGKRYFLLGFGSEYITYLAFPTNTIYELEINKTGFKYNGSRFNFPTKSENFETDNLHILGANNSSSALTNKTLHFYEATIGEIEFKSVRLIKDCPQKYISNTTVSGTTKGSYGMYSPQTGLFYGNANFIGELGGGFDKQ